MLLGTSASFRPRTRDVERAALRRDDWVEPVELVRLIERAESAARVLANVELELAERGPRVGVVRLRVHRLAVELQRLQRVPEPLLDRGLRLQGNDGHRIPRVSLRR